MTTETADRLPVVGLIEGGPDRASPGTERPPTALEQVFARHHPAVNGAHIGTPYEAANDAFKQLRDDNWVLIENLREVTAERDSLLKINTTLVSEKTELERRYRATAAQLGAIMQGMRSAGDTILAVIRQSMKAAAEEPGLAEFAPDGLAGKIQTEQH